MNFRLKKFLPNEKISLKSNFRSFFSPDFFKNQIIIWFLSVGFLVNFSNWIILKIFIKPVDFPIILHYNVYFGVDMTGSWKQVYFLPSIGFVLLVINSLFSVYFYNQKERVASYILLLSAIMIQLSLVIAAVSVIIINY